MTELVAALRAVLAALEAADTEYVIVGSTAAAAWGVARMTRDVDLVAMLSQRDIGLFLEALDRDDVYVPDDDARRAASVGGSFNVLHPRSGGKVDVFVASSEDAFTRSRLDRRVRLAVFGLDTWVATAEDVVLAKLRWRLSSRSEVQWRDCVEIAASQPLDRDYLGRWHDDLGVSDDLAELLAAVDRQSKPGGEHPPRHGRAVCETPPP